MAELATGADGAVRVARQAADARRTTRIRAVRRDSDATHGVPRSTAELRENGERVHHKRIAPVMKSINPAGVRLRRRHRTTIADPTAARAWDLIGRDFTATNSNAKYAGDHLSPGGRWAVLSVLVFVGTGPTRQVTAGRR
ncbi:hypothetical protein ACFVZC_33010 [Streptomyces marokkonensis]|uniref:Transposase n=1 Tax=Streptomyces marokkonensis TaxID=324855 RepID=A0ABW6QHE2_9ACTN